MSIEDIILSHDRRGISALRSHLSQDYCGQAAKLVLEHPNVVVIVTGFYILAAGAAETDGPPGAIAIGQALQAIGYEVVYVTDECSASVVTAVVDPATRVIIFPVTGEEESKRFADRLLDQIRPSVLISIERCGVTQDGSHRNWLGEDISSYNAKIDHLFADHPNTVGIGDGGNEIGMGNLVSVIPTVPSLVRAPCVTSTTKLIIASVSNWGGYGLVASISRQRGKDLLLSADVEETLLRRIVDIGAVDGLTAESAYRVDGFSLKENSRIIVQLHDLLKNEGVL